MTSPATTHRLLGKDGQIITTTVATEAVQLRAGGYRAIGETPAANATRQEWDDFARSVGISSSIVEEARNRGEIRALISEVAPTVFDDEGEELEGSGADVPDTAASASEPPVPTAPDAPLTSKPKPSAAKSSDAPTS